MEDVYREDEQFVVWDEGRYPVVIRDAIRCPHCLAHESLTASYKSVPVCGGRNQYRTCKLCRKKFIVQIAD